MAGIEIIKPAVDIGVATNKLEESQDFWGETVGLRYDHLLEVGGGIHQHRYDLHGAVLKLNSHRAELGPTPTGFVGLTTEADVPAGQAVDTPDGTPIRLVPALDRGVRTIIHLEADDARATAEVLEHALGAEREGVRCRIGETAIEIVEVPSRTPTVEREGTGIRYVTMQVSDLESAHAHALANGTTEGLAPLRLGDTAYVSFVLLPDGDWVELSQRASLTGPLPEVDNRV